MKVIVIIFCLSIFSQFHDTLAGDPENFFVNFFDPPASPQNICPALLTRSSNQVPAPYEQLNLPTLQNSYGPNHPNFFDEPQRQNNLFPAYTYNPAHALIPENPPLTMPAQSTQPVAHEVPLDNTALLTMTPLAIMQEQLSMAHAHIQTMENDIQGLKALLLSIEEMCKPLPNPHYKPLFRPESILNSSSTTASWVSSSASPSLSLPTLPRASSSASRKRPYVSIAPPVTSNPMLPNSPPTKEEEQLNAAWHKLVQRSYQNTHSKPLKAIQDTLAHLEDIKKTNVEPEHFAYQRVYIKIAELHLKLYKEQLKQSSEHFTEALTWFNKINGSKLQQRAVTQHRELHQQLSRLKPAQS